MCHLRFLPSCALGDHAMRWEALEVVGSRQQRAVILWRFCRVALSVVLSDALSTRSARASIAQCLSFLSTALFFHAHFRQLLC